MSRRGRKPEREVADISKASVRPLRRGGQLETICPSTENDSGYLFDKSPLKRDIVYKPLSYWKKKAAMLEEKKKKGKKKSCKGLFEMSSDDESFSSSEELQEKGKFTKQLLIKKPSRIEKPKKEVEPAWERLLKKNGTDTNFLSLNKQPPFFGLSSTPGKNVRPNIVKPSYFDFVSPIGNFTKNNL